jgi:hypothetical protein
MIKLYEEAIDLIARGVTSEALVAFQPSEAANLRFEDLIAREKHEGLLPEETEELDRMMEINRVLSLAKAKARLHLRASTQAGA